MSNETVGDIRSQCDQRLAHYAKQWRRKSGGQISVGYDPSQLPATDALILRLARERLPGTKVVVSDGVLSTPGLACSDYTVDTRTHCGLVQSIDAWAEAPVVKAGPSCTLCLVSLGGRCVLHRERDRTGLPEATAREGVDGYTFEIDEDGDVMVRGYGDSVYYFADMTLPHRAMQNRSCFLWGKHRDARLYAATLIGEHPPPLDDEVDPSVAPPGYEFSHKDDFVSVRRNGYFDRINVRSWHSRSGSLWLREPEHDAAWNHAQFLLSEAS